MNAHQIDFELITIPDAEERLPALRKKCDEKYAEYSKVCKEMSYLEESLGFVVLKTHLPNLPENIVQILEQYWNIPLKIINYVRGTIVLGTPSGHPKGTVMYMPPYEYVTVTPEPEEIVGAPQKIHLYMGVPRQ